MDDNTGLSCENWARGTPSGGCPANCFGCDLAAWIARHGRRPALPAAETTGRAACLTGKHLVAASAYAFLLPLLVVTGSVATLVEVLGELPALAAGVTAALVLLWPACRLPGCRPERKAP